MPQPNLARIIPACAGIGRGFPDEASEATGRLRDSLIDDHAFVPSLWPVEVGSVLLAAARRGRVDADE